MGHEGHEHDHEHDHHAHEHAHEHAHVPDESRSSFDPTPAIGLGAVARILHIDPIGGAAGDMLIAALGDLGVDFAAMQGAIDAMQLTGFHLERGRRDKHAIAAASFDVVVDEKQQPPRDYSTIDRMLDESSLPPRTKALARRTFLRLGEAEAKIHRQPLERVHFHEVGGVDAIVDVVGVCAGIAWLEAEAGGEGRLGISLSPLPLGEGRTRGAHGSIPVPAPAALELLIGLPVRDAALPAGFDAELVTPTGAALLHAMTELLPSSLGRWPAMSPRAIGYGAGRRDLPDRPNVVRLVLGTPLPIAASAPATHVVLEANVDDTTGEIAGAAIEALLAEGALDAWAQPITMKKGRPALLLGVMTTLDRADELSRALLSHTGSLGVRRSEVSRVERPRRFVDVETRYGTVSVKVADGDGLPVVVHPELDACRARADAHHVPVREVIRAAIAAFRQD
jgi:uncharacterized protein (TIGR00299 family) protein